MAENDDKPGEKPEDGAEPVNENWPPRCLRRREGDE